MSTLLKTESQRVVGQLRHLIAISGGRKAAARSLKISQARLSQVLRGASPGMKVLHALSREMQKPTDEILGRQTPDLQDRVHELEEQVLALEKDNRKLSDALEALIRCADGSKDTLRRCRVL